jgi:hypothetical protein
MWRLSFICTDRYDADNLKKLHGSVWVIRMWCKICTNPILRFNPEGLNCGDWLVGIVHEFAGWLMI